MSRLPYFQENLFRDGADVVSFKHRPSFTPSIYVRGRVNSQGLVRLEGLGQLKKSNDIIGVRTREIPACSIVPQDELDEEKRICSIYIYIYIYMTAAVV
jgi:hypothetical protein